MLNSIVSFEKSFLIVISFIALNICIVRCDTIAEFLCQNQPPNTRLQHPEFCDVYLICRNNKAVEVKCDDGVLFNPNVNDCDPDYRDCPLKRGGDNDEDDDNDDDDDDPEEDSGDDDEKEQEEDLGDDEETNDDDDDKNVVEAEKDVESPGAAVLEPSVSIGCPRTDTEQVTFIMHKEDCSIYYLCYHGKPIPFQCSMGMHWSNKQKKCVPKEVSECAVAKNSIESGCPARGIKFMPHPNVCQYFVFCLNGAQTIQRCEAFYHWDVNESKCKLKTLATCYTTLRSQINRNN